MGLVDPRLNIHYFPETIGLVNQIDSDKNKKLFFFEIDTKDTRISAKVVLSYMKHDLTFLIHPTKTGFHFLSPTLLTLEKWKEYHQELKDINPKCPMITLRVQGNKYPNEDLYFYRAFTFNNSKHNESRNIKSICLYLNKIFGTDLKGNLPGDIQTVRYKPHLRNES